MVPYRIAVASVMSLLLAGTSSANHPYQFERGDYNQLGRFFGIGAGHGFHTPPQNSVLRHHYYHVYGGGPYGFFSPRLECDAPGNFHTPSTVPASAIEPAEEKSEYFDPDLRPPIDYSYPGSDRQQYESDQPPQPPYEDAESDYPEEIRSPSPSDEQSLYPSAGGWEGVSPLRRLPPLVQPGATTTPLLQTLPMGRICSQGRPLSR